MSSGIKPETRRRAALLVKKRSNERLIERRTRMADLKVVGRDEEPKPRPKVLRHSVAQAQGTWWVLGLDGEPLGSYTEEQDGDPEFLARVHLVEVDGRLEALARGLNMPPAVVVRALASARRLRVV
jgi:hypothetical protein